MAAGGDPHESDLKYERENQYWKFYGVDDIGQEENPIPSTSTLFWYRAMEPTKYEYLDANNQFPEEKSYGGIANNHKYVGKYFTNKSEANRIVEFNTTKMGQLSKYFTENGVGAPKPETGAISYGLGDTGTKYKETSPRQLFNGLLTSGDITWRVVDKKVPVKKE